MLAAAPLPRRDDLDPPKDQPHGYDVDAFNAQHPSMLMRHIMSHTMNASSCSTPPRATSVSVSLKGAGKKNAVAPGRRDRFLRHPQEAHELAWHLSR